MYVFRASLPLPCRWGHLFPFQPNSHRSIPARLPSPVHSLSYPPVLRPTQSLAPPLPRRWEDSPIERIHHNGPGVCHFALD